MLGGDQAVKACIECGAYASKPFDGGLASEECKRRRMNPGRQEACWYPIGMIPVEDEALCVE